MDGKRVDRRIENRRCSGSIPGISESACKAFLASFSDRDLL